MWLQEKGGGRRSVNYKRKRDRNPGIMFCWIGQSGQNSNSFTASKLKRKKKG